jgi:hypothetical protein
MVVDLPSLDKVQVYLLSQPRLVPLVVLASPPELNSQRLREMVGLYAPLHIVPLPLSQQVTRPGDPSLFFFFHFLLQASPLYTVDTIAGRDERPVPYREQLIYSCTFM